MFKPFTVTVTPSPYNVHTSYRLHVIDLRTKQVIWTGPHWEYDIGKAYLTEPRYMLVYTRAYVKR